MDQKEIATQLFVMIIRQDRFAHKLEKLTGWRLDLGEPNPHDLALDVLGVPPDNSLEFEVDDWDNPEYFSRDHFMSLVFDATKTKLDARLAAEMIADEVVRLMTETSPKTKLWTNDGRMVFIDEHPNWKAQADGSFLYVPSRRAADIRR